MKKVGKGKGEGRGEEGRGKEGRGRGEEFHIVKSTTTNLPKLLYLFQYLY